MSEYDRSASRVTRSHLKTLLRLDLRGLYLSRNDSALIDLAYRIGMRFEKIGRKRRQFRIMGCPPLNMWMIFYPPRPDNAAQLIHHVFLRGLWRERGLLGRLSLAIGVLIWSIPVNIVAIAWMTAINGRAVARVQNKSVARLMLEQLHLAFAHNILAPWYFQFDLHDDSKRQRAGEYLHRFELKGGLFHMVNRNHRKDRKSPLKDKAAFRDACAVAGLPTLQEVGIARDGTIVDRFGTHVKLPAFDLFIKPHVGRGGMGAEQWVHSDAERWRSARGQELSTDALVQHLIDLSKTGPYLIQRRAVPHVAIADLSNGALPTVRVLTIKGQGDTWEPVAALFRMAVGANRTVDNFHAGGIAANVDLASGMLGPATDIGLTPDMGWLHNHPDGGAVIVGRVLPYWSEVLALARRAHSVFSEKLVAGWDIAILAGGPALVEGNGAPDTDMHQRVSGEPLGSGKFGTLFANYLLPQ